MGGSRRVRVWQSKKRIFAVLNGELFTDSPRKRRLSPHVKGLRDLFRRAGGFSFVNLGFIDRKHATLSRAPSFFGQFRQSARF
jgi:hypothetical protein